MPGKKKKKGGKSKEGKGGGDGKLPPPPKFDDQRQGAHEALLSFKIRGKEDLIDEYQEDAEVLKERNYHQKERNYHLKQEQVGHYQTLVQQARQYDEELDSAETVDRESVEKALTQKHEFARKIAQDLRDLERLIEEVDMQVALGHEEVDKWTDYKDKVQFEKAAYIADINKQIRSMDENEAELKRELEEKMAAARQEMEKRSELLVKQHKERIAEDLLQAVDKDSQAELADNVWLHKQIKVVQEVAEKLRRETDALEQRNLKLMEVIQAAQIDEIEATRELYLTSTRKGTRSLGDPSLSGDLPSLVNIAKCTAEQGPGGQAGQLEMKLLSVQGSKAPFNRPPETVHLPPIEEQRHSHSALPKRTSWPVSHSMLKSALV